MRSAVFFLVFATLSFSGCNFFSDMIGSEESVSVVYHSSGADSGTVPVDARTYSKGDAVTVKQPGSLTRSGYAFTGWNHREDMAGSVNKAGTELIMPGSDVHLYAYWQNPAEVGLYSLNYNGNGKTSGTAPVDANWYEAGEEALVAGQGSLTRIGYGFDGWNTDSSGSGAAFSPGDAYGISGANAFLYADWESWYSSEIKITASDKADSDTFGTSLAISGDFMVVGAPYKDNPSTQSGLAYVFERAGDGTWDTGTTLPTFGVSPYDYFGWDVDIDGEYIITGAYGRSSLEGEAYVVYRTPGQDWSDLHVLDTTGLKDTSLNPESLESSDYFGQAVAISGDYAAVGAWGDDEFGTNTGAVYIYKRTATNTWAFQTKIIHAVVVDNDEFGRSLDFYGDYLIVGAGLDNSAGSMGGKAYIFHRNADDSWDGGFTLFPSELEAGDRFGESVAVCGDYAVVGARGDDDASNYAGAVYIFKRTGLNSWSQDAKLTASDALSNSYFGLKVELSDDRLIVGAYNDSSGDGAAYIYFRDDVGVWGYEQKLTKSGFNGEHFGYSVDIGDTYAAIGANADDLAGLDQGSAFIYN